MARRKQGRLFVPGRRWSDIGADRGHESEMLFRTASELINYDKIPEIMPKPTWLTWIDIGSSLDDLEGTDAWARTDKGSIPIQVKSSLRGVRKHAAIHRTWKGLVFVVNTTKPRRLARRLVLALNTVWAAWEEDSKPS